MYLLCKRLVGAYEILDLGVDAGMGGVCGSTAGDADTLDYSSLHPRVAGAVREEVDRFSTQLATILAQTSQGTIACAVGANSMCVPKYSQP